MRGTQKRDKKNHVIARVQKFNPGQIIKYVRTWLFFLFFFLSPLAAVHRSPPGSRVDLRPVGGGPGGPMYTNLVAGPLGSVAGEPDRRQRQLLCLLPVQVAGDRLARRCVCSAHRPSGSMQVHALAWGATRLKTSRGFFHPDSLPNSAFHLSSSQSFLERGSGKRVRTPRSLRDLSPWQLCNQQMHRTRQVA
jgi:hypothetical protein